MAAACPPQLTGADLYALCADAWMAALKARIRALTQARPPSQAPLQAQDLAAAHALPHANAGGGGAGVSKDASAGAGLEGGAVSTPAAAAAASPAAAGVSEEEAAAEEDIVVCGSDFFTALSCLVPSLSHVELAKYEALRQHYEGQRAK